MTLSGVEKRIRRRGVQNPFLRGVLREVPPPSFFHTPVAFFLYACFLTTFANFVLRLAQNSEHDFGPGATP